MDEIWDLIESVSEGLSTYSCVFFILLKVINRFLQGQRFLHKDQIS